MRIDPQRLLRLGELIRQGSFKRAAETLAVTSPALSQSIAQMEAEVGVRLLERTPHGVVPTVYGEVLADTARAVETQLKAAAGRIAELAQGSRERLAVGGLPGGPVSIISLAVARLWKRMPDLDALLVEDHWSTRLIEQVEDRTIDVALCNHMDDLSLAGKRSVPFFQARRMLCVRKGHPAEHALNLPALADYPFVTPMDEMGLRSEMDHIFEAAGLGFPRRQIVVSSSLAAARHLLVNSDAFALLTDLTVLTEIRAGLIVAAPLPGGDDSYWNHLVLREDQHPSQLLGAFIAALAEICRELRLPLHAEADKLVARTAARRPAGALVAERGYGVSSPELP